MKYEKEYYSAVNTTSCRKWYKYINYGEKPFPCACSTRVDDCIFIELYDKLDKLTQLHKKEPYFKSELLKYKLIEADYEAILEWVKDNEVIGKKLYLKKDEEGNIKVNVVLFQEPYTTISISVNKEDFKNILQFKTIFSRQYCK